ncbi:Polyketide synthase modules and related proteins [hydrothermal vent metagenome]|uniref:Polyketide synthase modules and related proteins n=1 Tax=hydrothermal vent metagenome TaxID=652676 RepID=A0A3B0YH19_9ZZZZ
MSEEKKVVDYRALMKGALIELEKMQTRLNKLEKKRTEPIAIIGIGCRFSGADNTTEFWNNLYQATDSVTEAPEERWDTDQYFDPDMDAQGKMYTKSGSFLDQVDQFDPGFFNITPREAVSMDPQQRLLLEVTWESLEQAGIAPDSLQKTKTGVFVGITMRDYNQLSDEHSLIDLHSASGSSISVASGRLAYFLGTQGPTMTVDTACSSSLVSIHLACQSLRLGESNLALASGVNLMLSPVTNIILCRGKMLSPDGKCKTFDASANGFVRGEGSGSIVLKRLSDAKRDGDNVIAVIRGSACNHDGRSGGLTVPSVSSQTQVINESLRAAGVKAEQINYIEAHGTGTELGDPIEISALSKIYKKTHSQQAPLYLGSVKTNIGHLEGAAGIAGIIKACLCLQQEAIAPHLHFNSPNAHVDWKNLPIKIPTQLTPWKRGEKPRFAGVSSFGFSGTNTHIILQEAPAAAAASDTQLGERDYHLLCLSAKTEQALKSLVLKYRDYFQDLLNADNVDNATATNADRHTNNSNSNSNSNNSNNNVSSHNNVHSAGNISYTSHVGRSHFNYRLSLVGKNLSDWVSQLNAYSSEHTHTHTRTTQQSQAECIIGEVKSTVPKIGFLYTGQGSQYPDMCKTLYESEVIFRDSLRQSAEILKDLLPLPLIDVLYGEHQSALDKTEYTQPALFAIEIALTTLWKSWGVQPDFVLGHSLGEYVAACVTGVMTVKEGLTLVAARGRLMQALPIQGGMLSVLGDESIIRDLLTKLTATTTTNSTVDVGIDNQSSHHSTDNLTVEISAYNAPGNLVLSGQTDALRQVDALLTKAGIKTRMLNVSTGFHSALVEPMLDDFIQTVNKIKLMQPANAYISALTGQMAGDEVTHSKYWTRHIREAVNFRAGIQTLQQAGVNILIEIGPTPVLTGLAQQTIDDINNVQANNQSSQPFTSSAQASPINQKNTPINCLASIRQQFNNHQTLFKSLAELYTRGIAINWQAVDQGLKRSKVSLPTYAFQRQRYWLHSGNNKAKAATHSRYFYTLEWKENAAVISGQNNKREITTAAPSVDLLTADIYLIFINNNGPYSNDKDISDKAINSTDINDTNNNNLAKQYTQYLQNIDAQVITVQQAKCFSKLSDNSYTINPADKDDYLTLFKQGYIDFSRVAKIVHFWNIDNPKSQTELNSSVNHLSTDEAQSLQSNNGHNQPDLKDVYHTGLYSLVNLLQACSHQDQQSHPKIWIITQNAVATGIDDKNLSLHQTPVTGFAKAIAFEHQDLFGGTIDINTVSGDFDSDANSTRDKTTVTIIKCDNTNTNTDSTINTKALYQHIEQSPPGFYALRDNKLLSQRLIRNSIVQTGPQQTINKDSVYVISGGLGQLGLTITEWLVAKGAKFIALISRSEESEEVKIRLKQSRQEAEITTYMADLSQQNECDQVFNSIKHSNKSLAGVFHAAGSLHDSLIINQCWENFVKPLEVKITGTENLFNAIKDQSIDFLYLFSSVASVLAAPGQSNYSAANAFMDSFAHYAKSYAVPTLSIHWGAWSEAGMAADAIDKGYTMHGIQGMSNKNALAALDDIMQNQLQQRESEVVVCDFNWDELAEVFPTNHALSVLSEHITLVSPATKSLLHGLLQQNQVSRENSLAAYLSEALISINQISDSKDFEKQHILDLGMDSLMIMELIQKVRKDLDLQLYPKEIYEHPQVADLATYLQEVFEKTHFSHLLSEQSQNNSPTTPKTPIQIQASLQESLQAKEIVTAVNGSLPIEQTDGTDYSADVHTLDLTDADDPSLIKVPDMAMILSSPRAGSTLLRVMLGGHQDLFSPPELHLMLFSHLGHWSEQLKHSDFDQGLQRALMELNDIDAVQSKVLLEEWVQQKLSIAEVYQRLSDLSTKRILIDKSPTYAMYPEIFDRAERLFEQGKYIHLVRHPYAVIDSFVKLRMDKLLPYKTSNPYKTAEQIWLRSNKNVMRFFDRLPEHRKHFIKYEDTVINPQQTMQALCQFLEVPYDNATLSPYEKGRMSGGIYNESTPIGDPNFLKHNTIDASLADKWKSISLPIHLSDEVIALSEHYQYDLSETQSAKLTTKFTEAASNNMREETVTINGLDFCLCRWGNAQDPIVLMLHGILEQGAVWGEVAQTLVSNHYQVVAPDMRGQGKSQHVGAGGSYHMNDFIADLALLIEYLSQDTPIILVGHSFGSVVAALYASISHKADRKINQLILVETLLFQDTIDNDPVKMMRTSIDYMLRSEQHTRFATLQDAEKRFRELIPGISEALAHELVARILVKVEQGFVWRWDKKLQSRAGIAKPGNGTVEEYLKMIAEIDIPVSLIYGETSQYYKEEDADRLMSALAIADKQLITGGHYLPIDSPSLLADCIVSSLKKER